jgi:ABC-type phosphate transport system substrate-binding protein
MKKPSRIFLLFGIFYMLLQGIPDSAYPSDKSTKDVVVIGNKHLPFDSLSPNELKDIFQRKKTMWEDGQKISFAILNSGKTHQKFVRHYIQKTPAQYHRYWKKLVFSGRGVPPMAFRNERSLMSHIALTTGAIGYVSPKTRLSGVKVIKIIKNDSIASEKTKQVKKQTIKDETSAIISENSKKKESGTFFNIFFN